MYGTKTCPFCESEFDVSELKLFRKYVDHLESHAPDDDDDDDDDTTTSTGRPPALNCGFGMYPSRAPGDGAAETADHRSDPDEDDLALGTTTSGSWTPTD